VTAAEKERKSLNLRAIVSCSKFAITDLAFRIGNDLFHRPITAAALLEWLGKVAVGENYSTTQVNGASTFAADGGASVASPAALLALPTTMGGFSQARFAVAPELALKAGYQVTSQLRVHAGYDFLFWSNVVRPGNVTPESTPLRSHLEPSPGQAVRRRAWMDLTSGRRVSTWAPFLAFDMFEKSIAGGPLSRWTCRFLCARIAPRATMNAGLKRTIGFFLIFVSIAANLAHAQSGVPWQPTPKITVISPAGDPRSGLVDEAASFWNKNLGEVGSGFKLGSVSRMVQPVPEAALQSMSLSVVGSSGPAVVSPARQGLPGDITIFLAESELVSFTGPFDANSKRVIAIREIRYSAHERSERRAQRDWARTGSCDRPRAQQRSHHADVRPPGPMPACALSVRPAPPVSVDRRREAATDRDASERLMAAVRPYMPLNQLKPRSSQKPPG
jgi:hypothetical protein